MIVTVVCSIHSRVIHSVTSVCVRSPLASEYLYCRNSCPIDHYTYTAQLAQCMHISYCSAASLHVQSTDSTCMPSTHMQGVCSVELEFYVVSHCGIFFISTIALFYHCLLFFLLHFRFLLPFWFPPKPHS